MQGRTAGLVAVMVCALLAGAPPAAGHAEDSCLRLAHPPAEVEVAPGQQISWTYYADLWGGPDFHVTVSWGDGESQTLHQGTETSELAFGPHSYGETGTYSVRADADGQNWGQACRDREVLLKTVRVVPEPAPPPPGCLSSTEPPSRQVQADQQLRVPIARAVEEIRDYMLYLDWGDGTSESMRITSPHGFDLTHTYRRPGSYRATFSAKGTYDGKPCENPVNTLTTFEVAPAGPMPLRLRGPSRVETAAAISEARYATQAAGAVVIARSDIYPDALAGAPLAAALRGPLLLTPSTGMHPATANELARTLQRGKRVYLLGGEAALSATVAEQVRAQGYEVVRLAGPTRQETAVRIAETVTASPARVFLAYGYDFPDALIAGATAGARDGVLLLTSPTGLGAGQAYLDAHPQAEVVAVGEDARPFAPPGARVVAGHDVPETSRLLAQAFWPSPAGAALASAVQFPDGLTGGAHAAGLDLPLLLSLQEALPGSLGGYLRQTAPLPRLYLYGGTAALSEDVERAAAEAAGLR